MVLVSGKGSAVYLLLPYKYLIRMSTKQSSIYLSLPLDERESLKEGLNELNIFIRVFTPEQTQSTLWMMLYEALSSERADGLCAEERNMALFFYSEFTSLCKQLVKIDKCLEKLVYE
jgi:hypothetical protein